MALNKQSMINQLNKAMEDSDREMAATLDIPFSQVNNPQKKAERLSMATTMATMMFKVLTEQAEIEIPEHPTAVTMTGISGGATHPHTTNATPIEHSIGKII